MAIIGQIPQVIDAVAGEDLAAREYVFLAHPDAPYTYIDGIVSGRVYKTSKLKRHCSVNAQLFGFVVAAASAGAAVQVRTGGNMSGFSGLVAGATYQTADTAGTIERLENHRAALPNPVATALSTTELMVMPQKWSVRGKGYFCVSAFSNALTFATDQMLASTLLSASRTNPGASSSALKSYFCGGSGVSNVVDALTFSNELMADSCNLSVARSHAACGSSLTKTYTSGGTTGSVSDVVDSVVFATDTTDATDTGNLTVARSGVGSRISALNVYVGGGTDGAASNVVDFMAFASEGNFTDLGDLSTARIGVTASSSRLKLYFAGGDAPSNVIDSLTFSTGVIAAVTATLATARGYSGSASSPLGITIAGGTTGSASTAVGRLMFADETMMSSISALISAQTNLGGSAS